MKQCLNLKCGIMPETLQVKIVGRCTSWNIYGPTKQTTIYKQATKGHVLALLRKEKQYRKGSPQADLCDAPRQQIPASAIISFAHVLTTISRARHCGRCGWLCWLAGASAVEMGKIWCLTWRIGKTWGFAVAHNLCHDKACQINNTCRRDSE